ncbi:telomerase reverse transcriptase, putative [Babesia ovis]|uniref:Telomerase reverse transcriptase, putative n=1 Tax=Babesia ovis TaxID=5869 RepID=A0A9W5WWF4_BABOV|nr:telomerase reverse transcriptase, putative [Babesia ovis]
MTDCIDLICSNNTARLLEWLSEDSASRWETLTSTLRQLVTKRHDVSRFICENARLLGTGKVVSINKLFDDDCLNEVAAGLGSGAIYGAAQGCPLVSEEQSEIAGYRFDDFIQVLETACGKVESEVAFSAVVECLRHRRTEMDKLLLLLAKTIKRCDDRAVRITTAIGALSQVYNHSADLSPIVFFLRDMWSLDVQESHNVSKMTLISAALRLHTSILTGTTRFSECDSGIQVANLVCCWRSDLFSWTSQICIYNDRANTCQLDSTSLDDALCCFSLLTDERSVIPRVYSIPCLASMYIKVAHVLAFNIHYDAHSSIIILLETAIVMLKQSGAGIAYSVPLSAELIVALLGCCYKPSTAERLADILDFLIQTTEEDTRITLFGRVASSCNDDTSLSLCLGIFSRHVLYNNNDAQTRTISVLKRLCERVSSDVRRFPRTWSCLLSWLESLKTTVKCGSNASRLLLDLNKSLSVLVSQSGLEPRFVDNVQKFLNE